MDRIADQSTLREHYGEPTYRSRKKQLARLDRHCRHFISLSPFLVISSAAAGGKADVSPRGDAPGFVAVLDDHTLLIPDRPGNNRVDTMGNLMENAHVGMLFLLPGVNETLRVNGTASVTTDKSLLAPLAVQGKVPKSGIVVRVEEAFMHCAKALIRSKLWDPDSRIDRGDFPTMGRILADQIEGVDAEEADRYTEEVYRTQLY